MQLDCVVTGLSCYGACLCMHIRQPVLVEVSIELSAEWDIPISLSRKVQLRAVSCSEFHYASDRDSRAPLV